jgi:hypothetical protein
MAAVTGVIWDQGATATDKGGMVFNVKAYGALGGALPTNTQDDTQAFQDAIDAAEAQVTGTPSDTATSGRGGVVFVPQGVYRIKSTLTIPAGVSIRGSGMHTSQIVFALASNEDGLVWSQPSGPFALGGFLEDIDVKAESYTEGKAAQDLVVLSQWANFALNRVRILGASRYGLRMHNCVNITATHVLSASSGTSNLYIGASSGTVTTTTRFVGCYFQASQRGPAVDVAGLGIAFDACVFENSGAAWTLAQAAEAYGARVRSGTVTFVAPYFEANRSWELIAGTDVVEPNTAFGASVTVLNAVVMPLHDPQGVLIKVANTGGFKFERGTAIVHGGNLYQVPRPLVFTNQMDLVQAAAAIYPHLPEVEGATLAQLPGTVLYKKPATGQVVQAGNVVYGLNP